MKRSKMKVASTACPTRQWTLEWREHGRWVKSVGAFASPEQAMEHAEMIGAFEEAVEEVQRRIDSGELQTSEVEWEDPQYEDLSFTTTGDVG